MKKLISSLLCFAMLFSLCLPVTAAEITSQTSGQTIVTYGMSESFLVIIPGDFSLDNMGKASADIKAMNVMLGANKTLEVYISGDDYIDSWELIDETESSNTLTYTIGSSEGDTDIVNNSIVLSVEAGQTYDDTVTETLYFTVLDSITKSGTYSDTLTFTVSINGVKNMTKNAATFVAHRAGSRFGPENTLAAVEASKNYGFKYIEVDLCITADNHFVVIHDYTVDNMTDGTGTVSELTLEEIKEFNIDKFSNTYTGEVIDNLKIPTLEEFLEYCNENNLVPVMELKAVTNAQIDMFMDVLGSYNLLDKAIICAFDTRIMDYIRTTSNTLKLGPLFDGTFDEADIDYCRDLGNSTPYVQHTLLTQALVDYAHGQGVSVAAWTVNRIDESLTLENMGVDYILTDNILYGNKVSNYTVVETRMINDIVNGLPDAHGMVLYEKDIIGENNKDLIHFQAEILYTQDAPTLSIGNSGVFTLQGNPNEWRKVDILATKGNSINVSLKDKEGTLSIRNANLEVISVNN